jgi:hypothetical protein
MTHSLWLEKVVTLDAQENASLQNSHAPIIVCFKGIGKDEPTCLNHLETFRGRKGVYGNR